MPQQVHGKEEHGQTLSSSSMRSLIASGVVRLGAEAGRWGGVKGRGPVIFGCEEEGLE